MSKTASKQKPAPEQYDADQITRLEGLEPVRLRPGMYVGGTDSRALHHLIWEIVDNSVDEALAGYCDEIIVDLRSDNSVSVKDNGRGIPVAKNSKTGEHAVMMVFEDLHAGGKFGDGGYKVSGGLHGVGASVTNALSEWLRVKVCRDGYEWTAAWSKGKRTQELKRGRKTNETGTTVIWHHDPTIFNKGVAYSPQLIETRLKEKAYLVRGLKFILRIEGEREKVFQSKAGIADYVAELAVEREPLHPKVIFLEHPEVEVQTPSGEATKIGVEVALQWTKRADERLYSFANVVTTPDGGAHVTGLRAALTKALNNYAYETGKLKKDKKGESLDSRDVFAALTAAVSVKLENPQFEGQTKGKLNNQEARSAVQSFVYQAFSEWLQDKRNSKDAKLILDRCLHARKVRLAQSKVSKNYNPNSIWADTGQSEKLADCDPNSTVPALERELFIVEGDSAGGSAKLARDSSFQAILPIRGKIINVITGANDKVFKNKEVDAIIHAIGGRVDSLEGENIATLDPKNLRYGKIVITADADTDGAHISYLVLAIFHEMFPRLLYEGRVFIARPPLYRISLDARGDKVAYAYTDEERAEILRRHKRSGDDVLRFKGLGEMNPEHLEETVFSPRTRKLIQVTIEDAAEVAEMFNLVMGRDNERRKEWLVAEGGMVKLAA